MRRDDRERGMVMVVAVIAVISIVSLSIAMMTSSLATTKEYASSFKRMRLTYLAEAGVSRALHDLDLGGDGNLGTEGNPVPFGSGSFWTTTTANGNGTVTVESHAALNGSARAVAAVARKAEGAFDHAVFVGNSSDDENYELQFGGEHDDIDGDVYSGQDIKLSGSADLKAAIRARGAIQGATGETDVSLPLPDLAAANYEVDHDVDVAADFAAHGTSQSNPLGGTAVEVPEEIESHIFRLNPSDRTTECDGTTKDDYFLEDPYETVAAISNVTITGTGSKPGPSGNNLVYYVDGNLWIRNLPANGFKMENSEGQGLQVTFVAKGNIYLCDDLHRKSDNKDGIAFIAVKDESVPDSGNIYIGDPVFGNVAELNAFLYAENDVVENNDQGGGDYKINGSLSAGNHMVFNHANPVGYTRIYIDFDSRITTGTVTMPGLSRLKAGGPDKPYSVISMMEFSE